MIDLPYSDISKCSQPTQLRNWDDLNQHVEDFSDTAWAILFRNMIPKSTSITQNLMKLHVHRSVNLTRSNFVLLCNLVTLTLPTLGLSETLEFSKGIFHTSSLKNLSFSIRPDRDYEILYFNISQENSMVRFKDLPEAYQMSIRREMNSTLFETMRNIANSRGLCDVRGVRAHVSVYGVA